MTKTSMSCASTLDAEWGAVDPVTGLAIGTAPSVVMADEEEDESFAGDDDEDDADDDEDPEVVRQKVLDKLRAQGVDGDVKVEVDETEDGKREIRVEVAKEDKQIAPH